MLSLRESHFICVLWDGDSGRVESTLDGREAMKIQGVTLKQGIPQGFLPKVFCCYFYDNGRKKRGCFLSICNVAARVFLVILVGLMRLGSPNIDPKPVQKM